MESEHLLWWASWGRMTVSDELCILLLEHSWLIWLLCFPRIGLDWAERKRSLDEVSLHCTSDGGLDMLCTTVGQNMMLHKRTDYYNKFLFTDKYRFGQFWSLGTIWTSRRADWYYRNSSRYWYQKINVGMLPYIVMLLHIFGRGSSEFSGYHRDFCLSFFPGLTPRYPASLLEDQDFTPWGRWHWSILVEPFPFPLFPQAV